jgi:uncharacterized protein YciI
MATFAVTYHYEDKPDVLDLHRPAHREFLASCLGNPGLVAAGRTFGSGSGQALLLVEATGPEEVATMLDLDPFWVEGLITRRDISEWNVVIGSVGPDGQ